MDNQIKNDLEKFRNYNKISNNNFKLIKNNLTEFLKNGFPNKKYEDWKYSDLNKIITTQIKDIRFFHTRVNKQGVDQIKDKLSKQLFENNFILSVNGYIEEINFDHEDQSQIDYSLIKDPKNINTKNSLISLNNTFKIEHLKISINENYNLKKPLVLIYSSNKDLKFTNVNQKLDIKLKNNSQLKILNIFEDFSENNFFNINHQFSIDENATLKNYQIDFKENYNIKYLYKNIILKKNSILENFIFSSGSKFLKSDINCNLDNSYASAFVNGIINLDNHKHHEIKTRINHLSENTKSYQLIKSVLRDKSTAVYQGKIYVDKIAQKTDGYQLSKAVLLDEGSEFDGKPELEIYADDVKCSHGSTSGNLDENKIFYLMTRGLSQKEAKKLLIDGFIYEVIEKITDNEIKHLITKMIGIKNEY